MKVNKKTIFIIIASITLIGLNFLLQSKFAKNYVCTIEPGDFCEFGLLKYWILWLFSVMAISLYIFINKKQLK